MAARSPGGPTAGGAPEAAPGTGGEAAPEGGIARQDTKLVRGTAVALGGASVLFVGGAGSGKSGHALALMALGARLVSDDHTVLSARAGRLFAAAPPAIAGLIEARGVGLLRVAAAGQAPLALVVDLDRAETERLPPSRRWHCLGVSVPLLHKSESAILIPALAQYLRGGGFAND